MKKIVLIGYGGHAESISDSIAHMGEYEIVGYTDVERGNAKTSCPYLGTDERLPDIFAGGVGCAAICVGYLGGTGSRDRLYKEVKEIGFRLPVIIDKSAILAGDVRIGEGTYVGKGAILNAKSEVGKMCIINSGSVVEHETRVGDFSHVSVGAVLCGNVMVKDHVFVGANATVIQGVSIESGSRIGAGSTVLKDVPGDTTVYGVWNRGTGL
ncbi:MAG: acetyltransferase [Lachnospiraceae bacterium]|nr:acetyltransferase [Lachnospiraceae bacterium]